MVWVGKSIRAHSKLLAANKPTTAVGPARRSNSIKYLRLRLVPCLILAEAIAPGCNLGEFHLWPCTTRSTNVSDKKSLYGKVFWNLHPNNSPMIDCELALHRNAIPISPPRILRLEALSERPGVLREV